MKEDIEKIFGSEFRYLKKLSVGQLASLVWFGMSLFLRHCLPMLVCWARCSAR